MIARYYTDLLQEMLEVFPVVAVVGPRQVGKSTLVTQAEIGGSRDYLSLDDLTHRSVAESDPKAFLAGRGRVTIDEIQLVPDLLREIKLLTDQNRQEGRFLLTGSADLDHCADLSHVLAGRVGILRLPPLTLSECNCARSWETCFKAESAEDLDRLFDRATSHPFQGERLFQGGFPLSLNARSERARQLWFESFQLTYLERDLRRISDISNLSDFHRLMRISASNTGTLLNQAHLGRDAGLNPVTTGRYLSVLEASLLICRIPPFFSNIGKRFIKSPKLFWSDTGIAAHLAGFSSTEALWNDPMARGRWFETFVMMEIQSLLPLLSFPARLYHVRTQEGLEVDGLLEGGRRHLLFEVKTTHTPRPEDANAMERWIHMNPGHGPGMVIHSGDSYHRLSEHVRAIPANLLFGKSS